MACRGQLLVAMVPALLFVRNLSLYRPLPMSDRRRVKCSVLIPARNEANNIASAVRSVLPSDGVDLEVIVLDDNSTDQTAKIVREIAQTDARVRLETAAALPTGWCGKKFACHQLAWLARHPLLFFMDADVRVSRNDPLSRLAQFMEESKAALVSGVPLEETRGMMEKLVIPLTDFVLLAFLPLRRMRAFHRSASPRCLRTNCRRKKRTLIKPRGGHAAIAGRLHDGVALAGRFRSWRLCHRFVRCHGYLSTAACIEHLGRVDGSGKNAHEGLGSPRVIVPATLLLFGGRSCRFVCS